LEATELGREAKEISEDVVAELDASTERRVRATAGEGAELAAAAGFDPRPLAPRALARAAERDTATVWRAVLAAADEEDAEVIVLGSRGGSGFTSVLLGSVSYGVVHHATRPVLIIPPS
jgi:nucleotide-binding universal stress UspA family protein